MRISSLGAALFLSWVLFGCNAILGIDDHRLASSGEGGVSGSGSGSASTGAPSGTSAGAPSGASMTGATTGSQHSSTGGSGAGSPNASGATCTPCVLGTAKVGACCVE